jgi:hypothetical protein
MYSKCGVGSLSTGGGVSHSDLKYGSGAIGNRGRGSYTRVLIDVEEDSGTVLAFISIFRDKRVVVNINFKFSCIIL